MMKDYRGIFKQWEEFGIEIPELLADMKLASGDEEEIKDRFYRDLEFGTAGLRGILGAGTNRMNVFTIARATRGLCQFLADQKENYVVAIGYDSRINSDVFAKLSACVIASMGGKAYIYDRLLPAPLLSYASRELNADAGIMVTASHNPAKYNGYKVFGGDGCQIGPEVADVVLAKIDNLDLLESYDPTLDFDALMKEGKIEYISNEILENFYEIALKERVFPDAIENTSLKITYTPLNGTGNEPVRKILDMAGYKDITVVAEQEHPDGNFPTCAYPNPEFKEALELGLRDAKASGSDLLIATDPDADRVGIAVKEGDDYILLSGNEVGVMLLEYIIRGKKEKGTFPQNPVAVKTIVSTPLTDKICAKHGIDLKDVLTGFKFIGNEITKLEGVDRSDDFLLGYEESYGYLKGIYVRDKDAVTASLIIAEMAAYYKMKGQSLADVRTAMYEEYGYLMNYTENFAFPGAEGMVEMAGIMTKMRADKFKDLGIKVIAFADYFDGYKQDMISGEKETIEFPQSNVLSFSFEGDLKIIIRPSGTEPKIKLYYTVSGKSAEESASNYAEISAKVKEYVFG
ncbi:MAG: phospho-sugar mutase [Bacillota bacterium]